VKTTSLSEAFTVNSLPGITITATFSVVSGRDKDKQIKYTFGNDVKMDTSKVDAYIRENKEASEIVFARWNLTLRKLGVVCSNYKEFTLYAKDNFQSDEPFGLIIKSVEGWPESEELKKSELLVWSICKRHTGTFFVRHLRHRLIHLMANVSKMTRVERRHQAITTLHPTQQVASLITGHTVAEITTSFGHNDDRRIAVFIRQLTTPPLVRRQLVHHHGNPTTKGGFKVAEEMI